MKTFIFTLLYFLSIQTYAQLNDLLYFPKKGNVAGATFITTSDSELSGKLNGTKITISGSRTSLNQSFVFGLGEMYAAAIYLKSVTSATGETKVGNTSVSSNVKTGFQSPTLAFGGRFKLNDQEVINFNYLDATLLFNPKASEDNASRSDFFGFLIGSGAELDNEQKLLAEIYYTQYNANSNFESDNETDIKLSYQNNLKNTLFFKLSAMYAILSPTKYKSGDSITYSSSYGIGLAFGGVIKPDALDWQISYSSIRSNADYKTGSNNIGGDLIGNTFNFGLGYTF